MATAFEPDEGVQVRVVIVGAGIAGLTLARALESAPCPVRYVLLEAHEELAPQQGAGIALGPGGSRILDQLGAYDALAEQLVPTYSSAVYDERGRMLLAGGRTDTALLVGSRMGYPFGLVERRQVVLALLGGIRRRECILTGKKVVRIEHPPGQLGPVEVVCGDGTRYQGDIVVGADGVRSAVRSEMWRAVRQGFCGHFDVEREQRADRRPGKAMTSEYRCLYGISSPIAGYNAGCSDDTWARDVSTMAATGKNGIIFWFLFGRLPKICGQDGVPMPRFGDEDAEKFAQQHGKLFIREGVTIGDLWRRREKVTLVPLEEAEFSHWTAGRFVIIGDGAHKMTPQTGSGGMLAIEHAAALANIICQIKASRTNTTPLKTIDVEEALARFDSSRRHIRTSALIKQAGALARLEALRTLADRMAVRFLIPHAGDARADQLCGDAIGAERIGFLPLPQRSLMGTMPFNPDRGIGREEATFKRALWASPLLLEASPAIPKPLDNAFNLDILEPSSVLCRLVSYANYPVQDSLLVGDYGVWYVIMLIESSRRSMRLTVLQCSLLWGLASCKHITVFVPLYHFAHYMASRLSKFDAPDMRLTDVSYIKTALPALLCTHYPAAIMMRSTSSDKYRLYDSSLWEMFPLALFALQRGLSWAGLFPRTIQHDRLHDVTRDLRTIRRTVVTLSFISASTWQYALWGEGAPVRSILAQLITLLSLDFEHVSTDIIHCDQVLFALASIIWVALLFADMRATGHVRHGWLTLIPAAIVLTALGGSGAMLGIAWLYREEMLATRRHRSSLEHDPSVLKPGA
ncbi:hypothetical protein F5Y18DRAFT_440025 [Xylariaceae sp. FL1019]|nr:hypothetical protein F5Y18DRAFT_440025 [Xylariaceae sp. FL1019]